VGPCTTPPTTERQRLQSDITELVTEYAGQSIGSVDVGALVNSLAAVIDENHLFLPPGVMLLTRRTGRRRRVAVRRTRLRRGVHHGPEPVPRHQVFPTSPRRQVTGEVPRSPSGICLYFVTPTESSAALTTPNFPNINHITEQPDWN
jgi:hypothetical protein